MIVQLEDSLLKKEHPTQEESPESIMSTILERWEIGLQGLWERLLELVNTESCPKCWGESWTIPPFELNQYFDNSHNYQEKTQMQNLQIL